MNASDARQFKLIFQPGNAKFNTLAANIAYQYVDLVGDIVVKPRARGRYEKLKSEVIKKLANSDSTRMRMTLEDEEMGDRKLPQF